MKFSSRTGWELGESAWAAEVRAARVRWGEGLIDLTVSNPTLCGFHYGAEAILRPLSGIEGLEYDPDSRGSERAREAVAGYYADHGATVASSNIVLTTSTSDGYSHLFRLLCDAGDEVLVAVPSYPLFDFLADLCDVRLQTYPLFYDFGWWIDFAALEAAIGCRTRAILVVHPNNPTGHWTKSAERARLRELCARHGLALIVDEVFLDYPLAAREPSFLAEDAGGVLTFVVSGLSKICALPQMKVAWIVAHGAQREEALERLEVIADMFLSVSAPMQNALPVWLAGRRVVPVWLAGRRVVPEQIRRRVAANAVVAVARGALPVEAGWSAVVRTTASAEMLLRESGVVVHPGAFYGMAERNRVVVSLLGAEAEFRAGMERVTSMMDVKTDADSLQE